MNSLPKSNPQQDKLFEAANEIIIRLHLDKGRAIPSDEVRAVMAASWTEHLRGSGVDWSQVHMIYADAVKAKAKAEDMFPIAIDDMLAAWNRMVENGYWDKINEQAELAALPEPKPDPNSNGRKVWQMMRERFLQGKDAVSCKCSDANGKGVIAKLTQDGETLRCQLGKCDFFWKADNFMDAPVHPSWNPVKDGLMDMPVQSTKSVLDDLQNLSDAPPTPLSDDELLAAMESKCEMKLKPSLREHWVKFGRWMLEWEPVEEWSRALAKTFYERYQQEIINANA